MKRRTLDTIFAVGGFVVAALLIVLGVIIANEASFANNYVKEELGAQKISFATVDKLTDAEKGWKAGSTCLVTYAGQALETGAQAECYAKYYIREHMHALAESSGFPGATYATLGASRADLTTQLTAAKTKGDTAAVADLQKKLDAATSLRSTLQLGESLSGMLLTVYGFSVISDIASVAVNVLYALAALMVLLSIAGLVHAYVTPREQVVFGQSGVRTGAPATA